MNIKALAGLAVDTYVLLRIVVDEPESAREALKRAHIAYEESEVLTVLLENRAGELANVTNRLSRAGVNLRAIYLTGTVDNLVELAIVADDLERARYALEQR